MYAVGENNDSPAVAASRAGYVTVEIRNDSSVLARRPDGAYVDIQVTDNGPFASETSSPTVLAAKNAWQRGDHHAAIEFYRHGAKQGDVQAQVALGLLYAYGRRVEKDGREAAKWFAEAAKLGYADGQYRLGWMYTRGNGLPKDLDQAEHLLRQAAQQNHAAAAYELGSLLLALAADAQHMTEAVAWISKAAEAAHVKAQLQLAQLYSAGRGVPQDAALAEHWRNKAIFNGLLRAARKGDVEDELELARAYAAGKLIAADPQNAEWWYQRVIEKSGGLYRSIIAYEELGELFQRHGDSEKTKHYYTLAAEAGSTTALDKLKAMEVAQKLVQVSPIRRFKSYLATKDWKGKIIALIAVIVVTVALINGNKLLPPNVTPEPVIPTVSSEPGIPQPREQDDQEQRIQEAQKCLQEAKQLVRHIPGESQEERETKDLEEHWIQYLQSIQAQGGYTNWFDKPCDLYLRNHTRYANDAVAGGFATIEAVGNDLKSVNVSVTLTSNVGTTIILPVGTTFTSDPASSTQNMISAHSVRFTFVTVSPPKTEPQASTLRDRSFAVQNTGGLLKASYSTGNNSVRKVMFSPPSPSVPRTLSQDVPSYCVNLWKDIPNSQSQFSVSPADKSSAVAKLVFCLEDSQAPHRSKQLAVWMVSDNLITLTQQQIEDRIFQESDAKFQKSPSELAEYLKRTYPDINDDDVAAIRRLSPQDMANARSYLLPVLQNTAKMAAQEFNEARPLLQGCGYDLSNSAFFSQ